MKQIILFCDRIDTIIGGVENHRIAFINYFSDHKDYNLSYILFRLPKFSIYDKHCEKTLEFSTTSSLLKYLVDNSEKAPILFYNGGHWIEEYMQIRQLFISSIIIMRSGGNEIIKAPMSDMSKSIIIRQKIWSNIINLCVDIIISNSSYTTERMINIGIFNDKIKTIRGGVDINQCHANKKNKFINRETFDREYNTYDKFIYCIACRFVEFKGILETLKIFVEFKNNFSFHLLFIGSGILENEIIEYCNTHFMQGQFTFIGAVDNKEALKYISISNCLLNISMENLQESGSDFYVHTETMGRSMIEAICQDVPVIALNSGGSSEVFEENGSVGILINTIGELKRAIQAIKVSDFCFNFDCEKYSWTCIFQRYEKLILQFQNYLVKLVIVTDIDDTLTFKQFTDEQNDKTIQAVLNIGSEECKVVFNTGRKFNLLPKTRNFKNTINITENGEAIYINGKIDNHWKNYVKNQSIITTASVDIIEILLKKYGMTNYQKKWYSDYYLCYKFKDVFLEFDNFKHEAIKHIELNNILIIYQNNGIKLFSKVINKQSALQYIKYRYFINCKYIGIGNSTMDELFLNECNIRYYINRKSYLENTSEITILNYQDISLFVDFLRKQVNK